ncbi:MAG: metal ABC transporter ATP-binding protein [bacterium]
MSLITCENLVLGYEGRAIVRGLSFAVNEGDYLCILGENGSGKSTLIKTLLGLRAPMGGSIVYGGGLRQREIGYLPQQTLVQRDFPASVREIVLSGFTGKMGARFWYTEEEKRKAKENMEKLGLSKLVDRCYRELSGGQQQRVLLARALCATEKLLLLDEPAAGLDPRAMEELYAVLEALHREGITVLMVSHDVASSLRYATHVLHIGDSLWFGTKEDYERRGNNG